MSAVYIRTRLIKRHIRRAKSGLSPDKMNSIALRKALLKKMEARVGIEPALTDLQSAASPLCHRAILERETGFEPATSTLARLRSTN